MRKTYNIFFIISLVLLTNCGTVKNNLSLNKNSPDEFAVTTNKPLELPPEFNLISPGEKGKNSMDDIRNTGSSMSPSDSNLLNKLGKK